MEEQSESYIDENGHKFWYLPSKGKDYNHRTDCQLCSCSRDGGRCVCVLHRHSNGPALEEADGTKYWYVKGELHRLDGPAIEWASGSKKWYVNGKLHRLDGPAVEWANGSKEWYVKGELHRLDGPVIEHIDGSKYWWIDGKKLPTKQVEDWLKENNINLNTEAGQMALKLRWT